MTPPPITTATRTTETTRKHRDRKEKALRRRRRRTQPEHNSMDGDLWEHAPQHMGDLAEYPGTVWLYLESVSVS